MLIESSVRSYCINFPATFVSAQGCHITDVEDRKYLDFLSCCGSLNYGHNHPHLKQRLLEYIKSDGLSMSLDLSTVSKNAFLEAFHANILDPLGVEYKAQFTGPTGTNAVEAAIKLARTVTGRANVVSFTNAFHGCTLGSLAMTANSHHRRNSANLLTHVSRAAYDGYFGDDIDTSVLLDALLSDPSSGVDKPAAIVLEAIQGEGGINSASEQWLRSIENVAKKHGALLIVDDIQAGCGRSGDFFSFQRSGIEPDMVVLAKSLSGYGLPLALLLLKPELDAWRPGEHNGTFRGNNLAFVTGAAAFNHFWGDGKFREAVVEKAHMAHDRLSTIAGCCGAEVRGRGLMLGLKFGDPGLVARIRNRCFELGLILETCGSNDEVLKFLPPLVIEKEELDTGFSIVADAVADCAANAEAGLRCNYE